MIRDVIKEVMERGRGEDERRETPAQVRRDGVEQIGLEISDPRPSGG